MLTFERLRKLGFLIFCFAATSCQNSDLVARFCSDARLSDDILIYRDGAFWDSDWHGNVEKCPGGRCVKLVFRMPLIDKNIRDRLNENKNLIHEKSSDIEYKISKSFLKNNEYVLMYFDRGAQITILTDEKLVVNRIIIVNYVSGRIRILRRCSGKFSLSS
jgi:hypothetical protein